MMKEVMVWAGAGQIGMAIARRMGYGMKIVVGDKKIENAQAIAKTMEAAGFDALPMEMDLSIRESILRFINEAQKCGKIKMLVNAAAWRALEDAYRAGKLLAIGVSNFLQEDIENLWETAEIKPMVNQVLCHISNSPLELIDYCQKKGIEMEAYSPVAHGEALKNKVIADMAEKYGVTIPQMCIRFDIQLGMIVLPKTANSEHMKANADVDFTISDEDMEILKHVEKIKDYGKHSIFPVFGGKM